MSFITKFNYKLRTRLKFFILKYLGNFFVILSHNSESSVVDPLLILQIHLNPHPMAIIQEIISQWDFSSLLENMYYIICISK